MSAVNPVSAAASADKSAEPSYLLVASDLVAALSTDLQTPLRVEASGLLGAVFAGNWANRKI